MPVLDYCLEDEAHAPLTVGAESRSVLKRERAALDRANARNRFCVQYAIDYNDRVVKGS